MALSPRASPRLSGTVSPPCSYSGEVPGMPSLPPESILFFRGGDATTSAWVDRLQGLSVPGVGTPTIGADGSYFGGRPVAQSLISGGRGWRGTGLAGLPLSGTRPYTLSFFRYRSFFVSGNQTLIGMRSAASVFGHWVRYNGTTWDVECSSPTIATAVPIVGDTLAHVLEVWSDGSLLHARMDNVDHQVAQVSALAANQTTLAFGMADNATNVGNVSHAVHWVCSSKPSDAAIAVVTTWLAAYYG